MRERWRASERDSEGVDGQRGHSGSCTISSKVHYSWLNNLKIKVAPSHLCVIDLLVTTQRPPLLFYVSAEHTSAVCRILGAHCPLNTQYDFFLLWQEPRLRLSLIHVMWRSHLCWNMNAELLMVERWHRAQNLFLSCMDFFWSTLFSFLFCFPFCRVHQKNTKSMSRKPWMSTSTCQMMKVCDIWYEFLFLCALYSDSKD